MSQKLQIEPVRSSADWKAFKALPDRIYANDPCWVKPLKMDINDRLNTAKNPFFEHARADFWLARRGAEVVGRVCAFVDDDYNDFHKEKTGWFGWYESIDDGEVAQALVEQARAWNRGEGMERMIGPGCYTTNDDDLGFLIQGHDIPPMILNGHTTPYYQGLMEQNVGLSKVMDLYCYRLDSTADTPEQVKQFGQMILDKPNVKVRNFDPKHFQREIDLFYEVYNQAWEKNWGFIPMRYKEFLHHAQLLKLVIVPEYTFFAEVDGEPAGVSLSLPNLNEIIKDLNGHLFPFGWYKLLTRRKHVDSIRVFALGVKKKFRREGLGAVFYWKTLETAKEMGVKWGEMSWILENNVEMNKAIQMMGGEVYKTYRLYETPV